MKDAVYGIANTPQQAESIVTRLQAAGISTSDISVLFPDKSGTRDFAHEKHTKAPEGATTGGLAGMGVGGTLGLLAGIGAWLGPGEAFWLVTYSALAGGVLGVIVAVTRGYLRTAIENLFAMLVYWRRVGLRPVPNLTLDSAKTPRLAYAIPIFAGTVMTLWF